MQVGCLYFNVVYDDLFIFGIVYSDVFFFFYISYYLIKLILVFLKVNFIEIVF